MIAAMTFACFGVLVFVAWVSVILFLLWLYPRTD